MVTTIFLPSSYDKVISDASATWDIAENPFDLFLENVELKRGQTAGDYIYTFRMVC